MSERKQFRDLASPAAAHDAIASLDLDPGTETVSLDAAEGRVLAERVDATLDVPGFDRSALDGYALHARETFGATETDPATFDLVGVVEAGERPTVDLDPGEAVEIATGAVMPPDADAMVAVERTDRVGGEDVAGDDGGAGSDDAAGDTGGERVAVRTSVTPGENVMPAGADIAAGERALGPGTRLTAREIGLLAALGVDRVPVRAKPRVGIVSTGDELVRVGEDLDSEAGQIYDVNSNATAAAVREAGGEPVVYPHAGDDYDALEDVLREAAAECDLVCSSGSTSASAVDVIYKVIEEQGDLLLHGVAIKPGKPMLVGQLEVSGSEQDSDGTEDEQSESSGRSAYVGLPGYPVSALSIFRTFVAPAIRRTAGLPEPATATVRGRMAVEERAEEGRHRLVPVGLVENGAGETLVYPVDKGSGATTSLVEADGIVEMDAEVAYLDAGEAVTIELFSPEVRPPTVLGVGEDDPLLSRLLDRIDRPRYLGVGSRAARRWLRDGVSDIVAVTGDPDELDANTTEIGGWTREWGLVVPFGNPEDVDDLADLVDRDLAFVNRPTASGLRTTLSNAIADLADEREADRHDLVDAIDGFDFTLEAHESPARRVAAGGADAGLGLRATAEKLDCGFVPLGEETVRLLAASDRMEKPGVAALERALDDLDELCTDLPGFKGRRSQ
ncbi:MULTISPECIES: molybdopterin biosynthesis protein [Halococcus]|uniref:Molybdopterin biosynthesis protein MoeA/LysR substrate binding-domain-containing protein n=1 Tax=Halococcus salifodinae DSM 8989 TaxID=1227456 RepID=M0MXR4_9EURY|nr:MULTISPECIES: molybdopterin biosynthesis protein [Halococcus]EMA49225.1 molybdopterin biosynthesis protein MoeA/LysR substrate binding-domain-containing protein [Halococcus salifodinae DSM 8989]